MSLSTTVFGIILFGSVLLCEFRASSFQKATRKDRSRNLRSKRERATSPSAKEKTACSSQSHGSVSPKAKAPEVAHEAMAPSVSHCIRAVFAAFLWHEGIVHDAMACASFLKFHPDIGKDVQKKRSEDSAPLPSPDASGSDDRKVEEMKGQRLKRPSAR